VFNSTNGNRFQWSGKQDTIYVFRATIVDPTFSFCELSTEFAVYVYGTPLSALVQVGIVVGFIVTVLSFLVVSFFWYRRSSRAKEKQD
jgi:uncharacterized membrane protein (DUF485 family)